jgi:hypothetical protein
MYTKREFQLETPLAILLFVFTFPQVAFKRLFFRLGKHRSNEATINGYDIGFLEMNGSRINEDLRDSIAIVTGSNTGIGKKTAASLAMVRSGYNRSAFSIKIYLIFF